MADQKLLDYQSTKIRYLEYFSFLNCIFKVTFSSFENLSCCYCISQNNFIQSTLVQWE